MHIKRLFTFMILAAIGAASIISAQHDNWSEARKAIHRDINLCGSNYTAYPDPTEPLSPTPNDYHGATLRFGHEVYLMPLAAIMELGHVGETVANIDTLDRVWTNSTIFPMAGNIQLIFYRPKKGKDGDVLVKALLQEREMSLPVAPVQFPYYKWEDLKAYYIHKLDAAGR